MCTTISKGSLSGKNNAWAKTMTNYCRRIIDEVTGLCHKEIMTNQPTIQQTNQPTN